MSETKHEAKAGFDYARLAEDCDRWGLAEEAAAMRARYREAVIRQLQERSAASSGISGIRFTPRIA